MQLLLVEDDRPLAEAICDGVRQQGWQIEHAHVRAMMSPRAMTPRPGKTHRHSAARVQRLVGWQSRPATTTLVDCAASLIVKQAV